MQVNREWISISDMMAGLMMVFLFIAVLFMSEIQEKQRAIEEIAEGYSNIRQQLNQELKSEFKDELAVCRRVEILPDNTILFDHPEVLFEDGSTYIKEQFKKCIREFFPRYLRILTDEKYRDNIDEVRIEGHTSSVWGGVTREQRYIRNMELSQARAYAVLDYSYSISSSENKMWLGGEDGVLRANGMSFAKLKKKDGKEDRQGSRRVEFRVVTKAEERIYEIIDKLP